ncbi:MAG: hypothetical protein ABSG56_28915 [Bryobacteraceae bacterium]
MIKSWLPPATVCADVDSAKGALQVPEPPMLVETEAQDTVTAETGTVGQLLKVGELAWTVKFQAPWIKSRFCQLIEAVELPESTGAKSGFVALNVMVAGLTLTVKVAAGTTFDVPALRTPLGGSGATGREATGCPAAAKNIVMDSQAPIGVF